MPINAYTGLMGSGKSYEVVSSVIIEALAKGRRVVSNIDGLNHELICEYLSSKRGIQKEHVGVLIKVTNEQVKLLTFFCHGAAAETIVQPGDLVCIDEAWRFWGAGERIPEPHFIFFREHRHYVHAETKICCDLALMVQDISDLNRKLKAVVELTFRTKKHKSLGLVRNYVLAVHEGYRVSEKTLVNRLQKRYDPEIFPLYSSYAGGAGKELVIDKRQNMLLSKRFLLPLVLAMIVVPFGLAKAWAFFHAGQDAPVIESESSAAISPQTPAGVQAPMSVAEASDSLRLVGYYSRPDGEFIVLYSDGQRIRSTKARAFAFDAYETTGYIDGSQVAFWRAQQ